MGTILFLLAASAASPAPSRVQAVATATIVEGARIRLDSLATVPEARRRTIVRKEAGRAQPTELRLVEFQ